MMDQSSIAATPIEMPSHSSTNVATDGADPRPKLIWIINIVLGISALLLIIALCCCWAIHKILARRRQRQRWSTITSKGMDKNFKRTHLSLSSSRSATVTPVSTVTVKSNDTSVTTRSVNMMAPNTNQDKHNKLGYSRFPQVDVAHIRQVYNQLKLKEPEPVVRMVELLKLGASRKILIEIGATDEELESVGYYRTNVFEDNLVKTIPKPLQTLVHSPNQPKVTLGIKH